MVSGLGYQLLGVILEVGGCTADSGNAVAPDPFYVDQAVNTLEHLSEMGIPLVCEKWLTLPHNPSLLDIDNVISASTKVKKLDLKSEASGQNPSIVSTGGGVVLKRTKSLELSESSSATSESPSPGHHRLDKNSDTNSGYEMSTAFRGEVKSLNENSIHFVASFSLGKGRFEFKLGASKRRPPSHDKHTELGISEYFNH